MRRKANASGGEWRNMGNQTNWQIEQGCPQCGAPVTLDETDRLLACPFCRTRLYLSAKDHFRYYIPPAAGADGELIYIPYWRLRGSAFSATGVEVIHRFADTSTLAVNFPGLPYSLGLRPQVLKLRFVSPDTEGRFIAPDLPRDAAVPGLGSAPQERLHPDLHRRDGKPDPRAPAPQGRNPLRRHPRKARLLPAAPMTGNVCCAAPPAVRGEIRFVPTLCPRCGWDMEGERDSLS